MVPSLNESYSNLEEKLELGMAYAGQVIKENEEWLLENPQAKSKFMAFFSKCKCYLEVKETPILHSTLDPTSAPFVARSKPTLAVVVPTPRQMTSTVMTDSTPQTMPAPTMPLISSTTPYSTPQVMQAPPVPSMPAPPLPAIPSATPQWGPTCAFPGCMRPSMAATYPSVYQLPYYQPMASPPLCTLNPCPIEPKYAPAFAYPGQPLAPSPPLMTSPVMTLRSSPCSPESSMSLPATPVITPEPAGFSTFGPRQHGPVSSYGFPASLYVSPFGYQVPYVSSFSSYYGYPQ